MSLFEFWRRTEERRALLRRTNQMRLSPSQVSRLLGDSEVRAVLKNERMASLLPPVGTEVFRRFTPASLEEIKERHETKEKQQQSGNSKVTEKAPSTDMAAGKPLPFFYGDPPPELLTTPLEELDPFYQSQKTFMVLSKGNIIHRFNSESACFLLSPFSLLRMFAIKLLLHPLFSIFIMLTILTNCVFMVLNVPKLSRVMELIFMVIYVLEALVKVVSRGFCLGRFTFLRDPWNWLDLLIISTGCVNQFVDLGKLSVLVTIPRVLKIFTVITGMKKTVEALLQSVKRLADVTILMAVCLSILAVIGLQLFMGYMRQKCIIWPLSFSGNVTAMTSSYHDDGNWSSDFDFSEYVNNPVNYYFLPDNLDALLCGNSSDSGICPEGTVCLRYGRNPNYGYTNYDSFGWSLLSVIRLMTKDYWYNLLQLTVRAAGKLYASTFVLVFLPGCFFVVSLILAMVARVMAEQEEAGAAMAKRKEDEFSRIVKVLKTKEEEETSSRAELPEEQDSPQKKNSTSEIQSIEQEHDTKTDEHPSCSFIHVFLQGDCCGCWRWIKQRCHTFIMNPCFELGIILCLILNTVFLAMEHYPMMADFEEMLSISNLVFTGIFTAEMILKLVALGCSGYFKVSWHVFDFIIVVSSLLELGLADVEGLSVIRCFHLLRVFRLARWWPSFHLLLKMIQTSMGDVALVLIFMLFMFVVVGMQLFQQDYEDNVCRIASDCELPRWHMNDLFHTIMVIFRVLSGEWIETMWDCMEVSSQATCVIFFMMVMVIGHLLVLILFLKLLMQSFSLEELSTPEEKGRNDLHAAITKLGTWTLIRTWTLQGKKNHVDPDHKAADKDNRKEYVSLNLVTSDQLGVNGNHDNHDKAPVAKAEIEFNSPESEEEKKQQSEKQDEENPKENTPEDCCWESCCCPFQNVDTSKGSGRVWSNFRKACLLIIQHKLFEGFIVFIILLSSAALVFEDIHLQNRPVLQIVLDTADLVFTFLFLVEMFLKWIALGLKKYFTSFWCWLDFLVLDVSLFSLLVGRMGFNTQYLRAVRTLRIPSRFQGMKVVLNVLVVTLPAMLDVLLVVLTVWLIFGILGVNLFAGKFYHCLNETAETYFMSDDVNNKTECVALIDNGFVEVRWKNVKFNFDSVQASYLTLLTMGMSDGWPDPMYAAMDSRRVEDQPIYEVNLYMYLYYICFITIGCFFTFNLFIRSFISALQQQRHKIGKHVFMTEQQQKYSRAMKTLFSETAYKDVPRSQCHAWLFNVVTAPPFEIFMGMVICLDIVVLMVETYDQSEYKEVVLHWLNFTIILIFLLEFILKVIALRKHYFRNCLNIIDFVVIAMSIIGLFLYDLLEKYFITPHLYSLFRLVRISRILRFIRCAKGIRMLILGFLMSLPALVNIGLLLFVIVFTFSIIGMFNFAYVKKTALINDMFNFETFGNSMLSLMMVTTSSGWDDLLLPIMNTPPDCDPFREHPGSAVRGDCGRPMVGIIFFTTYINLFFLLVVYLFTAVILEIFNSRNPKDPEDPELLSDQHLQMFYETWRKFDPDASQLIQYSELSDLCDALQDPLRIPKPNNIKLIEMDLPLLPGDQIQCVDVLRALTTQVFGESGQFDALRTRLEEKFLVNDPSKVSQEPVSSTLQKKQEEVAASAIQPPDQKHLLQDSSDEGTLDQTQGGAIGISSAASQ